jgi:UDP-N-acetylglucosamine 2-epimerase
MSKQECENFNQPSIYDAHVELTVKLDEESDLELEATVRYYFTDSGAIESEEITHLEQRLVQYSLAEPSGACIGEGRVYVVGSNEAELTKQARTSIMEAAFADLLKSATVQQTYKGEA